MKKQPDLFEWASAQTVEPAPVRSTAKIIDAMPALIKRATIEAVYRIPNKTGGEILFVPFPRRVA